MTISKPILSFLLGHWSSLLMLIAAIYGYRKSIEWVYSQPSVGQQKMIPEYAVTIWESEARRRNDNFTLIFCFLVLFVPTVAVFVTEFFSKAWGAWFTIIRIIMIILLLAAAAGQAYITKRDRKPF